MVDRVRRFIYENRLLSVGDRVLVALSGGADSVALLHLLISLKEELSLQISAAHFHHGIRGEEADRDQRFVRALCAQWDVPLFCERADVPAAAALRGESLELCGRNLRYEFLEKTAHELGGATVATAHHQDDQVETVLWNLTRGSGLAGLGGIPVKRDGVIRPLLCCSREEIEAYCRDHALSYVTDSTNLSDDCTRNRLRHQVTPVLRELNPSVGESIARTAVLMREADEYFEDISIEELKKAETPYGYACERLLRLPPIVLRYAVKKVLENAGAPVDFQHIALIIKEMRSGGAVMLTQSCTVSCAQGLLRIVSDSGEENRAVCIPFEEYILTHGERMIVRGGRFFTPDGREVSDGENREKIHNLLAKHGIPCDIINCNTVYRYRRAGDTFTDRRRGITKSLKKLMNELKIPRELRDTVPLVAEGSTVLWMQGYGTSAQGEADLSLDGEIIKMEGHHA